MVWKIEVFGKRAESFFLLERKLSLFGIKSAVYFSKIYFIEGSLKQSDIERIAACIVADPVTETFKVTDPETSPRSSKRQGIILEVTFNPGVMDPESQSLAKALADMGVSAEEVRTAKKYRILTKSSKTTLSKVAAKVLYNPLIEHVLTKPLRSLKDFRGSAYQFRLVTIPLLEADEDALMSISKKMTLSLNRDEMKAVQQYFKGIGRQPTDCELETIAQTWSEHCVHKTFKGTIAYEEYDMNKNCRRSETITNLFKSTIVKATTAINSPYCVSVFHDNSGVIRFDDRYNVCFKVETHNHPSALEPFGGASTGVGGVIRDIIGTGQGAYPIANTDVFCFGLPEESYHSLPEGVSHPKSIIEGVVEGVKDYGNKMGIPTVNGAILFDKRYLANPLVYCGCVGLIPKEKCTKEVHEGSLIVVAGGHTGRDGIHGATFSSSELEESVNENSSFVQIGNAIEEKKLLSAIMRARDEDLFTAVTDCGAGGLSSAVGEIAKDFGAEVLLENVPLKYHGLSYTEIWISESQERMVLIVPKEKIARLKVLFEEESSELAVIGTVTADKKLVLLYNKEKVCELDMDFLHDGVPVLTRKAVWKDKKLPPFILPRSKKDFTGELKRLLSSYNICSKEEVFRQYDHEVQGGSMVKPAAGIHSGPSDAAVVQPVLGSSRAVAIGCGINPLYSDIDAYHMAQCCVDEAVRNVLCVGSGFERIALLDNFCWGNPEREEDLAALVRAAEACRDMAIALNLPFISGKDSFYNEFIHKSRRIVIPYTLLISAIGIVEDAANTISADFKKAGNLVYLLGVTKRAFGGSAYARLYKRMGNDVPRVDIDVARKVFTTLAMLTSQQLVVSLHDCSEGGLAVTLAEMSLSSDQGARVFLDEAPVCGSLKEYEILFSESPTRFIAEVSKDKQKEFEKACSGIPYGLVGCVSADPVLTVHYKNKKIINAATESLRKSFKGGFPGIFSYTKNAHR